VVVEQIIRPTGLVDPAIEVRPARGQVKDVMREIHKRAERKERVLVTTLTKRLAEELADYMREEGLKCCYLHSEVKTIERVEILNDLRRGRFDVVVGVNLLREGLDLPEVSLVAILDADKEGFLRSTTSLIQTIGRTARNVNARVILYADTVTDSMRAAMEETERRRGIQLAYNEEHGVRPETIRKAIRGGIQEEVAAWKEEAGGGAGPMGGLYGNDLVMEEGGDYAAAASADELERQMRRAAESLDFERAAALRDRLKRLRGGEGGGE
jgi:excinuclease ABC subunit B